TMEVEAVDEGVIGKLLIDAGTEGVKVNTPIAVLIQEGESADDVASAPAPKAEAANSDSDAAGGKTREATEEPSAAKEAAKVPAAPK
ncbi:MAG TPA: pyruvate dehydrogenase complex E1 component subunit beta, partial [Agrobacterium sp.]|nr:pyruvate dehydrogenase complex E1 component subunit beta [Agrobacterium sp.]